MDITRKGQSGFTMMEVIIAIMIFSIGALAVLTMKAKAVVNNGSSRQQAVASELCVSVLERLMMCDYWLDPAALPPKNAGDPLIDVTDWKLVSNTAADELKFNIRYPSPLYEVEYKVNEITLNHRLLSVRVKWPKHREDERAMLMQYVLPRDK